MAAAEPRTALAEVAAALRCPVCGLGLEGPAGGALRCARGHSFDVAREGYASLLTGSSVPFADTPRMVAARERFLSAGHFDAISAALATMAAASAPETGVIADLGAGTGHHLARVLEALPGRVGVALDVSKPALRRAARAHPRVAAVAADTWRGLPLADRSVALAVIVFAPRNRDELARVLRPDGAVLVVTPTPRHLAELAGGLDLLSVPEDKPERLAAALGPALGRDRQQPIEQELQLRRSDAADLILMGPNAHHVSEEDARAAMATRPEPIVVTSSVTLTRFRPADALGA